MTSNMNQINTKKGEPVIQGQSNYFFDQLQLLATQDGNKRSCEVGSSSVSQVEQNPNINVNSMIQNLQTYLGLSDSNNSTWLSNQDSGFGRMTAGVKRKNNLRQSLEELLKSDFNNLVKNNRKVQNTQHQRQPQQNKLSNERTSNEASEQPLLPSLASKRKKKQEKDSIRDEQISSLPQSSFQGPIAHSEVEYQKPIQCNLPQPSFQVPVSNPLQDNVCHTTPFPSQQQFSNQATQHEVAPNQFQYCQLADGYQLYEQNQTGNFQLPLPTQNNFHTSISEYYPPYSALPPIPSNNVGQQECIQPMSLFMSKNSHNSANSDKFENPEEKSDQSQTKRSMIIQKTFCMDNNQNISNNNIAYSAVEKEPSVLMGKEGEGEGDIGFFCLASYQSGNGQAVLAANSDEADLVQDWSHEEIGVDGGEDEACGSEEMERGSLERELEMEIAKIGHDDDIGGEGEKLKVGGEESEDGEVFNENREVESTFFGYEEDEAMKQLPKREQRYHDFMKKLYKPCHMSTKKISYSVYGFLRPSDYTLFEPYDHQKEPYPPVKDCPFLNANRASSTDDLIIGLIKNNDDDFINSLNPECLRSKQIVTRNTSRVQCFLCYGFPKTFACMRSLCPNLNPPNPVALMEQYRNPVPQNIQVILPSDGLDNDVQYLPRDSLFSNQAQQKDLQEVDQTLLQFQNSISQQMSYKKLPTKCQSLYQISFPYCHATQASKNFQLHSKEQNLNINSELPHSQTQSNDISAPNQIFYPKQKKEESYREHFNYNRYVLPPHPGYLIFYTLFADQDNLPSPKPHSLSTQPQTPQNPISSQKSYNNPTTITTQPYISKQQPTNPKTRKPRSPHNLKSLFTNYHKQSDCLNCGRLGVYQACIQKKCRPFRQNDGVFLSVLYVLQYFQQRKRGVVVRYGNSNNIGEIDGEGWDPGMSDNGLAVDGMEGRRGFRDVELPESGNVGAQSEFVRQKLVYGRPCQVVENVDKKKLGNWKEMKKMTEGEVVFEDCEGSEECDLNAQKCMFCLRREKGPLCDIDRCQFEGFLRIGQDQESLLSMAGLGGPKPNLTQENPNTDQIQEELDQSSVEDFDGSGQRKREGNSVNSVMPFRYYLDFIRGVVKEMLTPEEKYKYYRMIQDGNCLRCGKSELTQACKEQRCQILIGRYIRRIIYMYKDLLESIYVKKSIDEEDLLTCHDCHTKHQTSVKCQKVIQDKVKQVFQIIKKPKMTQGEKETFLDTYLNSYACMRCQAQFGKLTFNCLLKKCTIVKNQNLNLVKSAIKMKRVAQQKHVYETMTSQTQLSTTPDEQKAYIFKCLTNLEPNKKVIGWKQSQFKTLNKASMQKKQMQTNRLFNSWEFHVSHIQNLLRDLSLEAENYLLSIFEQVECQHCGASFDDCEEACRYGYCRVWKGYRSKLFDTFDHFKFKLIPGIDYEQFTFLMEIRLLWIQIGKFKQKSRFEGVQKTCKYCFKETKGLLCKYKACNYIQAKDFITVARLPKNISLYNRYGMSECMEEMLMLEVFIDFSDETKEKLKTNQLKSNYECLKCGRRKVILESTEKKELFLSDLKRCGKGSCFYQGDSLEELFLLRLVQAVALRRDFPRFRSQIDRYKELTKVRHLKCDICGKKKKSELCIQESCKAYQEPQGFPSYLKPFQLRHGPALIQDFFYNLPVDVNIKEFRNVESYSAYLRLTQAPKEKIMEYQTQALFMTCFDCLTSEFPRRQECIDGKCRENDDQGLKIVSPFYGVQEQKNIKALSKIHISNVYHCQCKKPISFDCDYRYEFMQKNDLSTYRRKLVAKLKEYQLTEEIFKQRKLFIPLGYQQVKQNVFEHLFSQLDLIGCFKCGVSYDIKYKDNEEFLKANPDIKRESIRYHKNCKGLPNDLRISFLLFIMTEMAFNYRSEYLPNREAYLNANLPSHLKLDDLSDSKEDKDKQVVNKRKHVYYPRKGGKDVFRIEVYQRDPTKGARQIIKPLDRMQRVKRNQKFFLPGLEHIQVTADSQSSNQIQLLGKSKNPQNPQNPKLLPKSQPPKKPHQPSLFDLNPFSELSNSSNSDRNFQNYHTILPNNAQNSVENEVNGQIKEFPEQAKTGENPEIPDFPQISQTPENVQDANKYKFVITQPVREVCLAGSSSDINNTSLIQEEEEIGFNEQGCRLKGQQVGGDLGEGMVRSQSESGRDLVEQENQRRGGSEINRNSEKLERHRAGDSRNSYIGVEHGLQYSSAERDRLIQSSNGGEEARRSEEVRVEGLQDIDMVEMSQNLDDSLLENMKFKDQILPNQTNHKDLQDKIRMQQTFQDKQESMQHALQLRANNFKKHDFFLDEFQSKKYLIDGDLEDLMHIQADSFNNN